MHLPGRDVLANDMTVAASQEPNFLDLSTCDKEPIRTPGSIQPHGFLLSLSDKLTVLQASDNLAQHIGQPADASAKPPLRC